MPPKTEEERAESHRLAQARYKRKRQENCSPEELEGTSFQRIETRSGNLINLKTPLWESGVSTGYLLQDINLPILYIKIKVQKLFIFTKKTPPASILHQISR